MTAAFEVWERGDARYPALLMSAPKPPDRLFARGQASVLHRVAVAVVGARKASPASLTVARRIGRVLADAGACVVSGLAVGVDAAAHAGALESVDGRTCAVLGGGLDAGTPPANHELRDRIAVRGLLLSEWEPLFPPAIWTFPHRNRIIAALCRATIVVEAGPRSGALHTARLATALGRELAVVPGPIDTDRHVGSNRLLAAESTRLIVEVEDVLELLSPRIEVTPPPPQLSDDEAKVWDALVGGPADIDTLTVRCHLPTTRCLAAITMLEIAGVVACELSGEIRRI